MAALQDAQELARAISTSTHRAQLGEVLAAASHMMGFAFYALSYHPQARRRDDPQMRLHNYPTEWEASYNRRQLALSDPIHRASHNCACGFRWRDVSAIIPTTRHDDKMLLEAKVFGIEDGYTVPANVPGEQLGSMTFASRDGDRFPEDMLLFAEAFGHTAFQQARLIDGRRLPQRAPRVTDRQLEIVVWLGRDKTDGEIAQILGVKHDTVAKHVRAICERLDAVRRTSLPLRAVFAGLLSFADIWP